MILGYLDNVNKGKLRMTASGRFWMLTSTSLIFLVRPTTAMLMKIGSQKTTSFRATLRTMRMNGTFRGPLRTTIRPSSTTLDPKLMSPVGLGTSWTSQMLLIWTCKKGQILENYSVKLGEGIRINICSRRMQLTFPRGGGYSKYKVLVIKDPPLPPGMPRVGVFR